MPYDIQITVVIIIICLTSFAWLIKFALNNAKENTNRYLAYLENMLAIQERNNKEYLSILNQIKNEMTEQNKLLQQIIQNGEINVKH